MYEYSENNRVLTFKQTSETVSAKRRITQIICKSSLSEFQAVGWATANA